MFVKIYNNLFDYGLKPKELMVFLFLSYCQNCLGTATVRNATIQQRCGLSENTIRSAVAGLEQKGLLVVSALARSGRPQNLQSIQAPAAVRRMGQAAGRSIQPG